MSQGGGSAALHESIDRLDEAILDRHRAIAFLREELEAVDSYDQRVQAADDVALRAILAHHRDEEKEHAVMLLEWLRRNDEQFDIHLRNYLFRDTPVRGDECETEGARPGKARTGGDGSLAVGDLRETR